MHKHMACLWVWLHLPGLSSKIKKQKFEWLICKNFHPWLYGKSRPTCTLAPELSSWFGNGQYYEFKKGSFSFKEQQFIVVTYTMKLI